MTAIDQDGQLHDARTTEVTESIESGADSATGVEDIVNEHHEAILNSTDRDVRGLERAGTSTAKVIAEHCDVEGADGDGMALHLCETLRDPAGKGDTAGGNTQENDVARSARVLINLMSDPRRHAGNVGRIEDGASGSHGQTPFPASLDGSLKDAERTISATRGLHPLARMPGDS
jgi:hypothetical protein